MPVSPRPSATVVLARDADHATEFLLVRRRAGDAFGDAYTFPGGVLDDDEFKSRDFCAGLTDADASLLLGIDKGGLDYYSAAVRELYEETGILLGAKSTIESGHREHLLAGTHAWADFLQRHELSIPCHALYYFTHWITPEGLPKRWSTRFFLAAAPAGQDIIPDGSEITDHCWLTAEEALASATSGERKIPFPTRKTIAALAGKNSVQDLVEWARNRQSRGIPAIQPEIREEDGGLRIFMPDIAD